jgi:surface protein
MKNLLLLLVFLMPVFHSCDVTDSEMMDLLQEIKNQNDALSEEIKRLQTKTDSLLNELDKSTSNQDILLARVDELQTQLGEVMGEMNTLVVQLDTNSSDMGDLKTQMADLQEKYEDILGQLGQLQQLSQILSELETMRDRLRSLESKTDDVLGNISGNQADLQLLKNAIATIQTQLAQNQQAIGLLTRSFQEQDADIERILSELGELKTSNEELLANMEALLEINQIFVFENGTVKCPLARAGDKGFVDGKIFEAVDRDLLIQRRDEGADLTCVCTSLVTNMSGMFSGFSTFNQAINNWDVSNVTNMVNVFRGASFFNQPIDSWNTSNVTNMFAMFEGASSFNQPIGTWDVGNVTNMSSMFRNAKTFNRNLNGWCVQNTPLEPDDFSTASALLDANKPIWGTCPD